MNNKINFYKMNFYKMNYDISRKPCTLFLKDEYYGSYSDKLRDFY